MQTAFSVSSDQQLFAHADSSGMLPVAATASNTQHSLVTTTAQQQQPQPQQQHAHLMKRPLIGQGAMNNTSLAQQLAIAAGYPTAALAQQQQLSNMQMQLSSQQSQLNQQRVLQMVSRLCLTSSHQSTHQQSK